MKALEKKYRAELGKLEEKIDTIEDFLGVSLGRLGLKRGLHTARGITERINFLLLYLASIKNARAKT